MDKAAGAESSGCSATTEKKVGSLQRKSAKVRRKITSVKEKITVAKSKKSARKPSKSSLLKEVLKILDDSKAIDVVTIDLKGKTSIADYMVIASGNSVRQVDALADKIMKYVKKSGYGKSDVEGLPHCDWVLVDCKDIIIHLFRPEVRQFYNIEKLWSVDSFPESNKMDKIVIQK